MGRTFTKSTQIAGETSEGLSEKCPKCIGSLTATDHVSYLLDSCSGLLYALRVLRSHGLPSQSLKCHGDRQVDLLCASVARFLSGLGLFTFELVPETRRQTRII